MARYDAFKAKLFRTDSAGRRVYVPSFRGDVYLIRDDAEAERIAQAVYRNRQYSFLAMCVVFFAMAFRSGFVLGVAVVAVISARMRRRLTATLEKSSERVGDLPPVDGPARRRAVNLAMGRRHFWDQVAASVVIGAFGAVVLFVPPTASTAHRDARMVLVTGVLMIGFALFSLVSGLYALRTMSSGAEARVTAS